MGWISTSGIFVIIWWVTLFAILPLWVKPVENPEAGISKAVPENSYIARKIIITTVIAIVLTAIIYALFSYGILNFDFVYRQ